MSAAGAAERPDECAGAAAGDLLPLHVEAVFRAFLDRDASPTDVAAWLQTGSVRAMLDGVLGSEEYRTRVAERERRATQPPERRLNHWDRELAQFCHPENTLSPDGVAIVGTHGHLFLYGGSNDNLAMFRGDVAMAPDWLTRWRELARERQEQASAAGRRLCCLIVPDKLAVYADLFPQPLESGAERPVRRLLGDPDVRGLLYPCDTLREGRDRGETFMVTDSHLTIHGNRLLARATVADLGCAGELLDRVPARSVRGLVSGDLGAHFDPAIVEVVEHLQDPSAARIVADNRQEVIDAGGHIGTRRVFRNDEPLDPRTVVVFGDSYGFGDQAYPGLSWFLAQVFREVHFVWIPFGWDPDYLDRVGAELVVCQTAERFVVRVPRARIDVDALVRESTERRDALGLDRVFGDVQAG